MKDFQDVLGELDGGGMIEKLTHELAAVIKGCQRIESKGELTIKLQVKAEDGLVFITPKVTTKIPTATTRMTAFQATSDGSLMRQQQLPLGAALRDSSLS